jgi:hypothetical protein
VLSADGRVPHSGQLRIVERFALDPQRLALMREYTAEDPLYFVGQYAGSDVVLLSDLPYHGATECEDRTYRNTDASTHDAALETDARPWWMFWKLWE